MKNYLNAFVILPLFTISFMGSASMMDEQEKSYTPYSKDMKDMTDKTPTQESSKPQSCRTHYVSQPRKFVGVDQERDMAMFVTPKENRGFFQKIKGLFS